MGVSFEVGRNAENIYKMQMLNVPEGKKIVAEAIFKEAAKMDGFWTLSGSEADIAKNYIDANLKNGINIEDFRKIMFHKIVDSVTESIEANADYKIKRELKEINESVHIPNSNDGDSATGSEENLLGIDTSVPTGPVEIYSSCTYESGYARYDQVREVAILFIELLNEIDIKQSNKKKDIWKNVESIIKKLANVDLPEIAGEGNNSGTKADVAGVIKFYSLFQNSPKKSNEIPETIQIDAKTLKELSKLYDDFSKLPKATHPPKQPD